MKLIFATSAQNFSTDSVYLPSNGELASLLKLFASSQFDLVETSTPLSLSEAILNKETWKSLFSILKENADLNITLDGALSQPQAEQITSFMKLNGFINVHIQDSMIQGKRPQWQAAGAPLKRKQQQQEVQSNPWASLQQENVTNLSHSILQNGTLINEDELMKDESSSKEVFQKFCGEDDKVKAGKPCENCTCDKKELEEGKITEKDLEVGNVQSSCGKCYLGDAFRCASCPYLGQPAFEPGDKVQLNNAAGQQTVKLETEEIKVKTTGNKVMLDI